MWHRKFSLGRCAPLLAAVAALTAPAVASAGTVSVDPDAGTVSVDPDAGTVQFAATPGEINSVELLPSSDGLFLRDLGAPLTAGAGCTLLPGTAADCGFVNAYSFQLLDRSDRADINVAGALSVSAGSGDDDVKTFSANGASLDGGPGDDTLENNADIPTLDGGTGDDHLTALGRGGSTITGGQGDDVIAAMEAAWVIPAGNTIDAAPATTP